MCALDLCRRIPLETSMIFGDQPVSVGERVTKGAKRAAVARPSSLRYVAPFVRSFVFRRGGSSVQRGRRRCDKSFSPPECFVLTTSIGVSSSSSSLFFFFFFFYQ